MRKKDLNFLVEVHIPKTAERDEVVFNITLGQLYDVLKTHRSGDIIFKVGNEKFPIKREFVVQIYNNAKMQIVNFKLSIPKNLRDYLIDLSCSEGIEKAEKISYRDEEIEKMWSCMLMKHKNNAILVGEHGVGKTTMVIEAVRQLKVGDVPKDVSTCKIIQLNTNELLKIKYEFQMNRTLTAIMQYIEKNKSNVILYIDDLLTMKYDFLLARMFMIMIKFGIRIIASITPDDYTKYFQNDDTICKYLNPIYLEEPDVEDMYSIISGKVSKLQEKYGVIISEELVNFAIFTGYHLSSSNSANPESSIDVINYALADAKRLNCKEVCKKNILRYYFINFKLEKKADYNEKKITAYHEVGHYLVDKYSTNIKATKNAFVSILPIDYSLGMTVSYEEVGKQLTFDKEYFIDEIAGLLGGRVGEELYTSKYSSGALSDLDKVNSMAEQIIMSYGLSNRESERNKTYTISGIYVKDFLLTDELKKEINSEITELIEAGYERATKIIHSHKKLLKEIVNKLLEEGILMGTELDQICENYESRKKQKKEKNKKSISS